MAVTLESHGSEFLSLRKLRRKKKKCIADACMSYMATNSELICMAQTLLCTDGVEKYMILPVPTVEKYNGMAHMANSGLICLARTLLVASIVWIPHGFAVGGGVNQDGWT